jgi:ParB family chromosome partitioning protein
MVPIIVRTIPDSEKFEILSGHNRVYASGMAGLERIPAVIKTNISDDMATVIAVETNLIQRSFRDLRISEQAFAVAIRYKKLFDEKKLAAIDEELSILLSDKKVRPPLEDEKKRKSDGYIRVENIAAEEYGVSHATIARLIRINELSDDLKRLVDTGNIKIRPAVELSYLLKELQKKLYDVMSELGISSVDMNTAKQIRELCDATVNMSLGQLADCYVALDMQRFRDILDNIVYLGLKYTYNQVKTEKFNKRNKVRKGTTEL